MRFALVLAGPVATGIIGYFLHRGQQAIHVLVNQRLTAALKEIETLNREVGSLMMQLDTKKQRESP